MLGRCFPNSSITYASLRSKEIVSRDGRFIDRNMKKIPQKRTFKPNKEEIAAATDKTVPDVIDHGLKVLFCGINPGLYSAAIGHHFGRPGNRFWPTLHQAGFTPQLFSPFDDQGLPRLGFGITNLVDRASAAAGELSSDELVTGAANVERKVLQFAPKTLAVVGITAYRQAYQRPKSQLGLQPECVGDTRIWVLPNPSGLNAHYRLEDFVRMFAELRGAID